MTYKLDQNWRIEYKNGSSVPAKVPGDITADLRRADALLQTSQSYQTFIIDDIRKKYGNMLKQGATTFWETEKGWEDFDGAGSLCHGWSAIPVYYLSMLS